MYMGTPEEIATEELGAVRVKDRRRIAGVAFPNLIGTALIPPLLAAVFYYVPRWIPPLSFATMEPWVAMGLATVLHALASVWNSPKRWLALGRGTVTGNDRRVLWSGVAVWGAVAVVFFVLSLP